MPAPNNNDRESKALHLREEGSKCGTNGNGRRAGEGRSHYRRTGAYIDAFFVLITRYLKILMYFFQQALSPRFFPQCCTRDP